MFLTRGVLPQAQMWEGWLRAAAGRVPLSAAHAGGCGARLTLNPRPHLCPATSMASDELVAVSGVLATLVCKVGQCLRCFFGRKSGVVACLVRG